MKKFVIIFIILILMPMQIFAAPAISAKSAVLIERHTGRIIYEKNANERLGMASTTKIMTAIVALENSKVDDIVTASRRASLIEGTSIYLAEGEKVLMEDLLYALMLNSGNDAATAIAEHIGKNEAGFVKLMNDKAKNLGLTDTHFTNPHGLADKEHYTTSYELAKITSYALDNPKFAEIVSTKKRRIARQREGGIEFLANHNKLLRIYEGATGVKTGFTKATGRTLVSSAERNGMELVAVTLNDGNDWRDHVEMLDYGFENYSILKIYNKGGIVEGKTLAEDVYVCLRKGEKFEVEISDKLNIKIKEKLITSYEFEKPKKVLKEKSKSFIGNINNLLFDMVKIL